MHVHAAANAALNLTALVLLCVGIARVKRGDVPGHKRMMLSALVVSSVFLVSYVTRATLAGELQTFPKVSPWRGIYLVILATHTVLAAIVPFLALRTAYLGWKERIAQHRRWAKVTFPIWAYVSATGVVIYAMLYHVAPGLE